MANDALNLFLIGKSSGPWKLTFTIESGNWLLILRNIRVREPLSRDMKHSGAHHT